jgi:hypothetical protein
VCVCACVSVCVCVCVCVCMCVCVCVRWVWLVERHARSKQYGSCGCDAVKGERHASNTQKGVVAMWDHLDNDLLAAPMLRGSRRDPCRTQKAICVLVVWLATKQDACRGIGSGKEVGGARGCGQEVSRGI